MGFDALVINKILYEIVEKNLINCVKISFQDGGKVFSLARKGVKFYFSTILDVKIRDFLICFFYFYFFTSRTNNILYVDHMDWDFIKKLGSQKN